MDSLNHANILQKVQVALNSKLFNPELLKDMQSAYADIGMSLKEDLRESTSKDDMIKLKALLKEGILIMSLRDVSSDVAVGNIGDALDKMERIIKDDLSNTPIESELHSFIYSNFSVLLDRAGFPNEALLSIEKAYLISPEHADTALNYAVLLAAAGQIELAREVAAKHLINGSHPEKYTCFLQKLNAGSYDGAFTEDSLTENKIIYPVEDEADIQVIDDDVAHPIDTSIEYPLYPYELLTGPGPYPERVISSNRENNLSIEDFEHLFQMHKLAFQKLPKWRQTQLKKALKLF
jgi:tetratricopeptide (TPR) repeat protein